MRRVAAVGALAAALCAVAGLTGCSGGSSGSPDQNLRVAIQLQNQGHLDQAKALYLKVLDKAPRNYFALFDLGVIAQAQGDTPGALSRYDAALAIKPDFVQALFNEGTIYASSDAARAMVIYRRVIALQPDSSDAYLNLGFLELDAGDVKQAIRDFAEAVRFNPDAASRMPKRLLGAIKARARHLESPTTSPAATAAPTP